MGTPLVVSEPGTVVTAPVIVTSVYCTIYTAMAPSFIVS
jgi:hypothetical protein